MTERIFRPDDLDEIVGAYWTDLASSEISYDMK